MCELASFHQHVTLIATGYSVIYF